MNLTEIINSHNEASFSIMNQNSFSTVEKYIYSYCDAAFRFLRSFEICRLKQAALTANTTVNNIQEMLNYERQSMLAIESVYTYVHRLELLFRLGENQKYDLMKQSNLQGVASKIWLNDLRFMSEIRNKIIEHAPENLAFHSEWGQVFFTNEPFKYRLWILHPDAADMLHNNEIIGLEIDRVCRIIWKYIDPHPDQMFGKMYDIVNGAGYLEVSDMKQLFNVALKKTGCISHEPTLIAAKISNIFRMVFKI